MDPVAERLLDQAEALTEFAHPDVFDVVRSLRRRFEQQDDTPSRDSWPALTGKLRPARELVRGDIIIWEGERWEALLIVHPKDEPDRVRIVPGPGPHTFWDLDGSTELWVERVEGSTVAAEAMRQHGGPIPQAG